MEHNNSNFSSNLYYLRGEAVALETEKKKNTVSDKKLKSKFIIRFFCTFITLIILILSFISLGWFTMNKETEVNSLKMSAEDDGFEIATKGEAGIYDDLLSNVSDGVNTENVKDESSNPITLVSTNGGEIKWKLTADSNIENNSETTSTGIQPGSKGTLTFYVIAKKSGTLNLNFSLSTILYEENKMNPAIVGNTITDETNPTVTKLVKGHILFFENYDENNKIYSDRINDSFTFNREVEKGTAYKVNIYWIWPKVSDQLILPKDDTLLTEKEINRIVDNQIDIIDSNYDNFFYNTDTTGITPEYQQMLNKVKSGSASQTFDNDDYKKLNDMWNSADQKIGIEIRYMELRLNVQKQTPIQE